MNTKYPTQLRMKDQYKPRFLSDLHSQNGIEIHVAFDCKTIWINVDNICVARIFPDKNIPIEVIAPKSIVKNNGH
jgi:hypothetical protein